MKATVIIHRKNNTFRAMAEVASTSDANGNYGVLRCYAGMYGKDEVFYIKRVHNKPHRFEAWP